MSWVNDKAVGSNTSCHQYRLVLRHGATPPVHKRNVTIVLAGLRVWAVRRRSQMEATGSQLS